MSNVISSEFHVFLRCRFKGSVAPLKSDLATVIPPEMGHQFGGGANEDQIHSSMCHIYLILVQTPIRLIRISHLNTFL